MELNQSQNMSIRDVVSDVGQKHGYTIDMRPDAEPQVVVVGITHYSWHSTVEELIGKLKPAVVLSEDIVDSNYLGKEGKFQHEKCYNQGSEIKQRDIEEAPVVYYVRDLGIDVLGIEDVDRESSEERELHFFDMIRKATAEKGFTVAEVGHFHTMPESALVRALKSSEIPYAVLYCPRMFTDYR